MSNERIIRHKLLSRLMHWLMAASILALLATGLLPKLGVKFDWLVIHWVAGLTLTALLLFHIVRALFFQKPARMMVGFRDIRAFFKAIGIGGAVPKPGKYTLAQKLMHNSIAVTGLVAVGTGLVMLLKIDTPWWKRNPYILPEPTWGIIYVLHDLTAFLFVSLIMLHIYFALRPEKFFYFRSMLTGWISRKNLDANHDPARWSGS
jgi:formate dehydrogenase subunit gamma